MQASIRNKAHLSEYIRQVTAGETVTINVHNPVAQIVPIKRQLLDDSAAQPGIHGTAARLLTLPQAKLPVGGLSDCLRIDVDRLPDTSAWVKLTHELGSKELRPQQGGNIAASVVAYARAAFARLKAQGISTEAKHQQRLAH